jgi:transcription initiation factor TFIID subunit TAF12
LVAAAAACVVRARHCSSGCLRCPRPPPAAEQWKKSSTERFRSKKFEHNPAARVMEQKDAEEAKEKESAIDSEEFADMVFDIDYSKHLLDIADDFLENKTDFSGKTTNSKVSFVDANK